MERIVNISARWRVNGEDSPVAEVLPITNDCNLHRASLSFASLMCLLNKSSSVMAQLTGRHAFTAGLNGS